MNNQLKNINLENLLYHANNYTTWLNILPHDLKAHAYQGGYNFGASGGLKLRKGRDGYIFLANYSKKFDIPSGNLYKVTCHLHGLEPKGNQQDFLKTCKIIADASGQVLDNLKQENYTPPPITIDLTPRIEKEWIPNRARAVNQSFDYQFHYKSQAMLDYFDRWGINIDLLKHYEVYPLRFIHSKKSSFSIQFNEIDFAFAYYVNKDSNIKYKRPNANKERGQSKEAFIQSSGNYVFGYNQLPQKGKILIIAAGEKDTLVINQHFNKDDIYAICFTSETTKPPLGFIQQLRKRFDKIFTCFDNDIRSDKSKNTGKEMMKRYALELGVPYINIASYSKQNDVADIYENDGLETLQNIIYEETRHNACVAKRPNDPFSIPVSRSLEINIQQYIGEDKQHLNAIKSFVNDHPKLILQSRTGTGKSWAIMEIVRDVNFLKTNDCDYAIITVPTTAILKQLEADFENRFGEKVIVIDGSSNDFDCLEAWHSSIILATYDSLHKIDNLIERAMLFVDEFHELRNAHSYRTCAVQEVYELMQIAKRCIALSATPLLHFAMNILNFDFKLCRVVAPQHQNVNVQPYIYEQGSQKDAFQHCLNSSGDKGTHIIRVNNVNLLEAFQIKAKQEDKSFDIFSSKKRIYKEDNPNYQSIMEQGTLTTPTDWIGTTALFDAGASFRFPVASVNFLNPREKDSFVQHLARPRYDAKTGMNQQLHVNCYHSSPKTNKRPIDIDLAMYYQFFYAEASIRCQRQNLCLESKIEANPKYFEYDYTYWSHLHGEWRVDELAILNHLYEIERQNDSIESFYQRIQYYHPHINVLPPIYINLEEDVNTKQYLKTQRDLKKEWREEAKHLLTSQHLEHLMEAVWHTSNNIKLKRKLKKHTIIHPKVISDHAQALINEYRNVFDYQLLDEWMIRACRLIRLGFKTINIPKVLLAHPSRQAFQHFYNQVVTHFELRAEQQDVNALNGKSLLRLQQYHTIIETTNKWKDNNRKRKQPTLGLTLHQIKQLLSKALNLPNLGERQALMAIKELFHVTSSRKMIKGRKWTFYTIHQRITLQEIFRMIQLDESEHYQRWKSVDIGHLAN